MTEQQLALDVGGRRVKVEVASGFTALQFAVAAQLSPDEARAYLKSWGELGICEQASGRWTLTPKGRRITRDLARWSGGASE